MSKNSKMLALLNNMNAYHKADLSPQVLAMYADDLRDFSIEEISAAWKKYRTQAGNVFMPTPAKLLTYIPDGRPDANEAWAMMPWDEEESVVWTEEMRQAFSVAFPLYRDGQRQSAFFAFKEVYERMVTDNRNNRVKPVWSPSFGFDKAAREIAIKKALEKNRITPARALEIMPEYQIQAQETLLLTSEKMQNETEEKQRQKALLARELVSALGNPEAIKKLEQKAKELFPDG